MHNIQAAMIHVKDQRQWVLDKMVHDVHIFSPRRMKIIILFLLSCLLVLSYCQMVPLIKLLSWTFEEYPMWILHWMTSSATDDCSNPRPHGSCCYHRSWRRCWRIHFPGGRWESQWWLSRFFCYFPSLPRYHPASPVSQ